MTIRLDANEFQEELHRLDAMLHEAEEVADPAARGRLQNIVQAVLHLHGVGLERLLEIVADSSAQGQKIVDACGADDVVSGLLLLHGLHPADARERVRTVLESVRPMLHSHGGDIEFVELHGETVRLRLLGNCSSSTEAMRQTVEQAIFAKAPEVTVVEFDEMAGVPGVKFRVALPVVHA
ncbi:MAG TPA: NifU family protein [Gemmataceae bacterium]|nr:NifU family protein [Gemmataceae bacterium]